MRSFVALIALFGASLLATGCGDEKPLLTQPEVPPSETATFARVQAEVFTPTCAIDGCHRGPASAAQEGMVLSAGDAYRNIVGVLANQNRSISRVEPFNLANSYLWRKISPRAGAINGQPMPLNGSISDAQRQLVRDWILLGAKNN